MVKIYAFHGTNLRGFKGIGPGDYNRGGFVGGGLSGEFASGWFDLSGNGHDLGRGIYASTSYDKALAYGDWVYLLEFEAEKLRLVDREDYDATWRKDPTVDGAYAPAFTLRGGSELDEFCMRGSALTTVWLIRYPAHPNNRDVVVKADNWNFEEPWVVRDVLTDIVALSDLPRTVYITKKMLDDRRARREAAAKAEPTKMLVAIDSKLARLLKQNETASVAKPKAAAAAAAATAQAVTPAKPKPKAATAQAVTPAKPKPKAATAQAVTPAKPMPKPKPKAAVAAVATVVEVLDAHIARVVDELKASMAKLWADAAAVKPFMPSTFAKATSDLAILELRAKASIAAAVAAAMAQVTPGVSYFGYIDT